MNDFELKYDTTEHGLEKRCAVAHHDTVFPPHRYHRDEQLHKHGW